jgi:hypothetical protein
MEELKDYDISQFKGIRELLVPPVIRKIMQDRNLSDDQALHLFYASFLYSKFEVEATKLWHLSPHALCDLLTGELETGRVSFPEEA